MLSRILRYLMLLALVVWLGGIIFFGAVMAPVLFNVLPSTELAGNVIAPSLKILHAIGLTAGAIFVTNFFLTPGRVSRNQFARLVPIFVLVMLALTAISQFYVIPKMENLRPQMASADSRLEFDSLHHWSTRMESMVLILGLFALAYFVDSDSFTTKETKHHKGKLIR